MNSFQIDDNYEHQDSRFEYVLENILMQDDGSDEYQQLKTEYNSQLVQPCSCSSKQCNNSIETDACIHGGNYTIDKTTNELVINSTEENYQKPFIECGSLCPCFDKCVNRLVQLGPRKHLQIFNSARYKSKGLKTLRTISRGAFICEYAGELLTRSVAVHRTAENEKMNSMNYVLCLKERTVGGNQMTTIVDPSKYGNIGRYLNHSCDPNCVIHAVRVDCAIPKIAIFTKRKIDPDEELCFHYGGGCGGASDDTISFAGDDTAKTCLCGSKNCTKYMPNTNI